ncbi:MAG: A24 family peptidase [Beijerinckiaceae bacterium]
MLEFSLLVFFPFLLAFAGASDLFTMTISNRVSLALMAGFFVFAFWVGLSWQAIGMHLLASILMLLITFAMFTFGWMGGGDAKLASATALWFGFAHVFDYVLMASLFGGLLTLVLLRLRTLPLPRTINSWEWARRLHDKQTGIPYGIALAAAALMVYPQTEIWVAAFGR